MGTVDQVILVNEHDHELGFMEKIEAHQKGVLHRAFSICLFNKKGELMLQKRSADKYHSAGLWTNTCCSHPRPNENLENALNRRLMEEMGIQANLIFAFKFIYKATLDHELIEHELDHVYKGFYDGNPVINLSEVEDWKYVSIDALRKDITQNPYLYSFWLKEIVAHPEFDERHSN